MGKSKLHARIIEADIEMLAEAVRDLSRAIRLMHPNAEALAAAEKADSRATGVLDDLEALAEPASDDGAGEGVDAGAAGGEAA